MENKHIRTLLYIVMGLSAATMMMLLVLMIKLNFAKPSDTVHHSSSTNQPSIVDSVQEPDEPEKEDPQPEDPSEPDEKDKQQEEVVKPDVYADESVVRIVNPNLLMDASYVPENLVVSDCAESRDILLREDAAKALREMFDAAAEDGIYLNLLSGYRDYALQSELYDYYVERFGKEYASYLDCRPGMSEHQTGLAVDLGVADHENDFNTDFQYTDEYEWLLKHSYEYGYILRYPGEKREITHVMFSPWNFRFTGEEEAQKLFESGLCMEEYYLNQESN